MAQRPTSPCCCPAQPQKPLSGAILGAVPHHGTSAVGVCVLRLKKPHSPYNAPESFYADYDLSAITPPAHPAYPPNTTWFECDQHVESSAVLSEPQLATPGLSARVDPCFRAALHTQEEPQSRAACAAMRLGRCHVRRVPRR